MDQFDYAQLEFLLKADRNMLYNWYSNATDAELIRANLIMDLYANYLKHEIDLNNIDQQIDEMPVLVEAQAVIAMVSQR